MRLIALLIILSSAAHADGIDDPDFYKAPPMLDKKDPNYYRDVDKHPCRYPVGPKGVICRNPTILQIPWQMLPDIAPRQAHAIPEPQPLLLFIAGITALVLRKIQ